MCVKLLLPLESRYEDHEKDLFVLTSALYFLNIFCCLKMSLFLQYCDKLLHFYLRHFIIIQIITVTLKQCHALPCGVTSGIQKHSGRNLSLHHLEMETDERNGKYPVQEREQPR
ncbi:hypothetical protein ATANTOWER_016135 [Ataeniobius toweri]|uniref:Uncharacterized protein n=1 Tax=Ataeniobius toweri TaxID=208326 RepID=A0ABU7A1U2_9TELE|nr:hypothetical protein [Ataeniobius toweri]